MSNLVLVYHLPPVRYFPAFQHYEFIDVECDVIVS